MRKTICPSAVLFTTATVVGGLAIGLAHGSPAARADCAGGMFGNPNNGTGFTPSGGFAPSGPCHTDDQDSAFLSRLAQAGMTPSGGNGALGLIGTARHICSDIEHGSTPATVADTIQNQAPTMDHGQIVALIDAAHAVYCPSATGAAPW
ncbi:MAG TPA: DUF732 domain-containing protein [Candidatus Saccharimonadales bacterium]|nr:DUF732 domain-containing protein [Candidatus Saccharimonadales bacterium]